MSTIQSIQTNFFKSLNDINTTEGIRLLMNDYADKRRATVEENTIEEESTEEPGISIEETNDDIPNTSTIIVNGNKVIFSYNHLATHFGNSKENISCIVENGMKHIFENTINIVNTTNKGWSIDYDVLVDGMYDLGVIHLNSENKNKVFFKKRKGGRDTYSKMIIETPKKTNILKFCIMAKTPVDGLINYKNNEYNVGEKSVYIINTIFPTLEGYVAPSSEIDSVLLLQPSFIFQDGRTKEEYSTERVKKNLYNCFRNWDEIALCE